ncbi:hypothetical protein [Ruminococcus sp.]|uniref:hypothetical protein n=1 Tax=Ruminococcus sp. TaxID=41978 RepID=UPI0039A2FE5E
MDSSREDDAQTTKQIMLPELLRIITYFYQYAPSLGEMEAEELKDVIQETFAKRA